MNEKLDVTLQGLSITDPEVMTAFTLPGQVTDNLKRTVDDACANIENDIPGISVVVVGRDGKELFAHAAGKRGVTSSDGMTLDNVFWIASCTKMVTGIACMQLVEQEKLHLDDGDELERLIPELKDIHVLTKVGQLVPKKNKITLRMLLAHTGMYPKPSASIGFGLIVHSWFRVHLFQPRAVQLLVSSWV